MLQIKLGLIALKEDKELTLEVPAGFGDADVLSCEDWPVRFEKAS